jgi:predicted transcriptional regulator of viral defense system
MEITRTIKEMPYLSKTALASAFDKNPHTLRNSIAYWKKNGSLIQIKRGYFVFNNYLDKKDNALYYPRFIATKMIEPSYLSKEFVLQDYGMFADSVYNYSIITIKKTQAISNQFGTFYYQSIKPGLFCGFLKKTYGHTAWSIATKAKALFDYLYFNKNKFRQINADELGDLRLNLKIMNKKDWLEFFSYAKKADKKMQDICHLIKKYANR